MEPTWWTNPDQLDADQKGVVALPSAGNHLVLGPPGSGKTNLLILRATYLHHDKIRDTAVLTFGRVLREFLASGTNNYPFADTKIQTYIKWAKALLRVHGVEVTDAGPFTEVRARLLESLQLLLQQSKQERMYDCILIDEAQDYSADEISVIRRFTKQIFAVGDDRQRIFEPRGAIAQLSEDCQVSRLRYHYRNGLKICRVADGILDLVDKTQGLEASAQYDEAKYPSNVRVFAGLSIRDQVEAAIVEVQAQLRAYPGELIGLLCPRHVELNQVTSLLDESSVSKYIHIQQHSAGYEAFDPDRPVIATTLHSAKGLEFRAAHLVGLDNINGAAQARLAYTGVTRAKTSLALYHAASLPGYLERGLAALEPRSGPPSLSDLFRG